MEKELLEAAVKGSVETLQKLLQQDALILHRYISGCFEETPLHIAAMFGHLEFTRFVLSHIPEMARELDSKNSTPLHVATAHGHIVVVKELLLVNPEMCFAKDSEGRNPVHIAVIKGHTEILKELVHFKPQAARATLGSSTVLHLCVKHYQLDALKYILEVIPNEDENVKDEEGCTILHLAVASKQIEVVKYLLQERRKVDVNAINIYGFTASDITLAQGRKDIKDIEIAECFQQAGESGSKLITRSKFRSVDIKSDESSAHVQNSKCCGTGIIAKIIEKLRNPKPVEDPKERKKRLEDSCNALMIVASLIATVTFEALIQRPNGLKEEDETFEAFIYINTLSFSASIAVILLLISGFSLTKKWVVWSLRVVMWIAVLSAALTYYFVMIVLMFKDKPSYSSEIATWIFAIFVAFVLTLLFVILAAGNIAVRAIPKMVRCCFQRYFPGWMETRRGTNNSNTQDQNSV